MFTRFPLIRQRTTALALAGLALTISVSPASAGQDSTVADSVRLASPATVAPPVRADSAAPSTASGVPALRPVNGPLSIRADLSARKVYLYGGDELIKSYDVAIGTPQYPTPKGSFRIRKIVWNPPWVPPDSKWARKKTAKAPGEKGNPMKVAKIFFKDPDYYIHGTGDTESLGSAASHGCLRMAPTEVAELGRYLMEHGGKPREESWFRRVLRFRSEMKVIYLDRPIPLNVTG